MAGLPRSLPTSVVRIYRRSEQMASALLWDQADGSRSLIRSLQAGLSWTSGFHRCSPQVLRGSSTTKSPWGTSHTAPPTRHRPHHTALHRCNMNSSNARCPIRATQMSDGGRAEVTRGSVEGTGTPLVTHGVPPNSLTKIFSAVRVAKACEVRVGFGPPRALANAELSAI